VLYMVYSIAKNMLSWALHLTAGVALPVIAQTSKLCLE
jgi:hypothetical protein